MNTGSIRLMLTDPSERKRSQQEIADYLAAKTRRMTEARVFVNQEQTISASGGGARSGLPVQYVMQNQDFEKIRQALPRFLDEVNKSSVFQTSDVNLKFNKPQIDLTIDRDRARRLGVSVIDIAQTLQLAFSGQRFSYFEMNGFQYQVIGQVNREDRDEPLDLTSLYVRNNRGPAGPAGQSRRAERGERSAAVVSLQPVQGGDGECRTGAGEDDRRRH